MPKHEFETKYAIGDLHWFVRSVEDFRGPAGAIIGSTLIRGIRLHAGDCKGHSGSIAAVVYITDEGSIAEADVRPDRTAVIAEWTAKHPDLPILVPLAA
jgi:hypothetical protein